MNQRQLTYLVIMFCAVLYGQNNITLNAVLNAENNRISITQTIRYKNTSNTTWTNVYLNDWNNSYSSKNTPLAKRFEEEFNTKFHLAKSEKRGFTQIKTIQNTAGDSLKFTYLNSHPDIINVTLKTPIKPGETYNLNLSYLIKLPEASFTDYGYTNNSNFNLKYWYITPTAYTTKWHYYSNKDLDDLYVPKHDIELQITYPKIYTLTTELDQKISANSGRLTTTTLMGKNRIETFLSLNKTNHFNTVETKHLSVITDIKDDKVIPLNKALITDRVATFLIKKLGQYPHKKLLLTEIDYNRNPLYGINQLPDILRPFPNEFQYELKLLKTALTKYTNNTLLFNPRKEYWINEAIQTYLLITYIEDHYPDLKLFGSLANIWGLRAFHGADLKFNFQYYLYFMEMARRNNDQPLTTSKDSLIKFNANIAGKYKGGMGLKYVNDFAPSIKMQDAIKDFFNTKYLQPTTIEDFKIFLKKRTTKNIDWLFTDYVGTRKKMDFKIKKVRTNNDSISVTIKNKQNTSVPIPLFALKNDSIYSKVWVENIKGEKLVHLPKTEAERFVLDYEDLIPEFNKRDNFKTINNTFFNKPLQFRLFKDLEDPNYNQLFLMPLLEFSNIYDGITLGAKFYNKTLLRRRLNYRFSPQYATKSKSLTGSASVFYTHNLEDKNLFNISYGMSANYQSFAEDAFFTRFRPSIEFRFRDNSNFRKDTRDRLLARFISIKRHIGDNAVVEIDEPDYSVLNLRYQRFTPGLINYSNFSADVQIANKFSKVSATYEFRQLTQGNRNINIRLFAGAFLDNRTNPNSDFFSFALDRPTDYLFDFNYLGRSEASGITSQQIIIAEGGFKSQLETPFANQWMTTANVTTSIWRYIQVYGDVGFVKNRFNNPKFVYDSGIRLNLVEDYFELYFPIYSNLGWEIAQPGYDERIRFIFTVNPKALLGLFTRKWY